MQRSTSRLVAETLLVLASVVVGFGVAEFGDYRADRRLARVVLGNLRSEVEANAATLDSLEAQHLRWRDALGAADLSSGERAAYEVLFATRPTDKLSIGVPLRDAAWNTALSTGALRLLEYDVAAALAEIYGYQRLMTENHNRLAGAALYQRSAFDPAETASSVRLMWGVMGEIAGNEQALRALYEEHLPLLARATKE